METILQHKDTTIIAQNQLQIRFASDKVPVDEAIDIIKKLIHGRRISTVETWKPIQGWSNYQVSSHGRVKNKSSYIFKQSCQTKGYPFIHLTRNGDIGSFMVHRLVFVAFSGGIPEGKEVNHIDGDKTNNFIGNLEAVTSLENSAHAIWFGLMKSKRRPLFLSHWTDLPAFESIKNRRVCIGS